MYWPYLVAIVGSVLGATGLFNLIQFLITRKDTQTKDENRLAKELELIRKDIEGIRDEQAKIQAINARVRILQCADSIRHAGTRHSEEYFDQIHEDITNYENYCASHQGFKNNKAIHAIEFINTIYSKALLENDFL